MSRMGPAGLLQSRPTRQDVGWSYPLDDRRRSWQYLTVVIEEGADGGLQVNAVDGARNDDLVGRSLSDALGGLGTYGWELAAAHSAGGHWVYVFKRQVAPDE